MSETSQILNLPFIQPAQAQKHVTHNEALRMLDAIVQLSVADADRTEPPVTPQPGDRHIVGIGATGDWAGKDGQVAIFDFSAWVFVEPKEGWQAYDRSIGGLLTHDGSGWAPIPVNLNPSDLQNLDMVGINASADGINRLSVSAEASLFSHDGAGHQLKVNKAAAGETASLLFQSGFVGHAEMGLAGDTAFSVKVSPDGAAWTTALSVDPGAGIVTGAAVQQSAADVTPGRLMVAEHGVLRADILGTVTQSGGVPTGALFESGSHSAGTWARFADGTQICRWTTTLTYDSGGRLLRDWTYPVPFLTGSDVSVSLSLASEFEATPDPEDFAFFGARHGSTDGHAGCSLRLYRRSGGTDFQPGDSMQVYAIAIGRWS